MEKIDRQTFQTIFDMLPIGLGIAALNGKLLIYNEAILKPGGYTPADIEILNSVVELYYDPKDRETVMGMAKKDGMVNNFRVRFKRKNGEPYYTLMSLRPVQFEGEPGWLATVIDIDEQAKAEERVNEKMEEIEKLNKLMIDRELKMVELKKAVERIEGFELPQDASVNVSPQDIN